MTVKSEIRTNMKPGQEYKAEDFKDLGKRPTVSQALSQLSREGAIKRVGHGTYVKKGTTLRAFREQILKRSNLFSLTGKTFGGDRDIYETLGYKRNLRFKNYFEEYRRTNIAKRIVDAFPKATWRNPPKITDGDEDSEFSETWERLVKRKRIWHCLERADRQMRLGRYSVILIGLSGSANSSLENDAKAVQSGIEGLLYLRPLSEDDIEVEKFVTDPKSPRFGKIDTYKADLRIDRTSNISATKAKKTIIHSSRTIHIAEDLLFDDVFGTPALEPVFNNLEDLTKVVGGSSEAVWRVVDRGLAFIQEAGAEINDDDEEAMDEEIERYIHDFQRTLQLRGVDVKELGGTVPDPRGIFQIIAQIISGTSGIPMRILLGSERGQLASSQDERNFNARVRERQMAFAEPTILRPLIEKAVEFKVLPPPKNDDIIIEWPDLTTLSEEEMARVRRLDAMAARNWLGAVEAELISGEEFREKVGFANPRRD